LLKMTPSLVTENIGLGVGFGNILEKLEWCGYPMVKKIEDIFIRFDMIHERDRQMDGRTDR